MPRERTYLRYQVYRSEARKRAAVRFAKLHSELEARAIVDVDYSKVRFEAIDASAMKLMSNGSIRISAGRKLSDGKPKNQ